MISPPVNAGDPPSTPETIFGTNQQSARKIRDSPTISSAPMAGFAEVATVSATATHPMESDMPADEKEQDHDLHAYTHGQSDVFLHVRRAPAGTSEAQEEE